MTAQPKSTTAWRAPRTATAILLVLAVLVIGAWGLRSGCVGGSSGAWQRRGEVSILRGESMGTSFQVSVVGLDAARQTELATIVRQQLDSVDARMSTYREDSELSQLNRHRIGEPMSVSADLFEVLTEAARIHELTAGAFDVTVAPLVRAWGFGAGAGERGRKTGKDRVPPLEVISAAAASVGMAKLELDAGTRSVKRTVEGLDCDLSAIAKGYAVDRVARAFAGAGVANFMVEVGGEIRAHGKVTSERGWRVGIERPADASLGGEAGIQEVVELRDTGMATSGDYRNYFEVDGQRLSHTIDPRAARPVIHNLASVTVVHPSAMTADAWATGLTVLGPDLGMKVAEANQLAVYMLLREGRGFVTRVSSAYARLGSDTISAAGPDK